MKFKCINNERFSNDLTLNKEYEATDRVSYGIWIKNDSGRDTWYNINRFIEVEETQANPEPETEKIQTEERKVRVFETLAIRSDNTGRERPDFISPYALHALGRFLANTENSFARTNYFKGLPIESCWESISRHYIELGIAVMKGTNQDEIKQTVAALTFNGIAMLHTLELKERGEYKIVQDGTKIMTEEEFRKLNDSE